MAKRKNPVETAQASSATVGYEAQLWQMADALRGSMDAAEYKHVVLGLIFLKYISDAFEEHHARLEAERAQGADPKDPDLPASRGQAGGARQAGEYRADNIFWLPLEACGKHLREGKRWKYGVPLAFVMYRPFWRKD
ncbi:type I restriction-modification system, M subunit [Meiothermus luteus]|uniref:Type I restriction-modification system, M subunit n=1 Tax=Meiothermus luteus TaxID=2026184 RepID=A0A399ERH3_9DEIN|nr:type I restriction-modification system subunit M N-terminal domain-containing protein [Meiothermus luteus]RIH86106.1 type I restriction-modification system, M subunit [Meiothermus luteus]